MNGKYVVGEKCKITKDEPRTEACFKRAKLKYKVREHKKYLGQWAQVHALFADNTAILLMHDGEEVKFPLDCLNREGVSNLVRKGTDTSWPKETMTKHEAEMKRQLKKLTKQNEKKNDDDGLSDSESASSVSSDPESPRRKSRKKKSKKVKEKDVKKWKVGDKVMAKFRDEMQQGTITGVEMDRKPPYDVYLDSIGVTYQMHPHELEECEKPKNFESPDLKRFLETLNLQQHHKNLVDEGFETLADLENCQMDDLRAVGFKRGHARRLMKGLEEQAQHPDWSYAEVNQALQKRNSFIGHRASLMQAIDPQKINALLSPEAQNPMYDQQYNQQPYAPGLQRVNEVGADYQQDVPQNQFPLVHNQQGPPPPASERNRTASTSSTFSLWEEDGYLIIPFDKRPLGFGIMSPLFVGTMVSTITDESLKKKGLGLGLPLLSINNFDVTSNGLESVANILSRVELPFTVTFGLQPYFKPGQKVMVSTNNKWYPATVVKMSKTTRKVTVKYDNNPFRFSNTEKIADYNRIKQKEEDQAPAAANYQQDYQQASAVPANQAQAAAYDEAEAKQDNNYNKVNQQAEPQYEVYNNTPYDQQAAYYAQDNAQQPVYYEEQQQPVYYEQQPSAQQYYQNAAPAQQYYQAPAAQNYAQSDSNRPYLNNAQAAAILASQQANADDDQ